MTADRTSVEGQIGTLAVVILSALNILFSVLGIIGNVVTCLAVWKNSLLQAGVNLFIVSLSVADLLVCVFTQPIYVLSLNGFSRKTFQIFYYVVTSTSLYASLNNLLLLTTNRVFTIFYPLRYNAIVSKRNIVVAISLVWLLSLIEGVLRTFTSFRNITPHIRICAVIAFILMYAKIFYVANKQRRIIILQARSLTYNHKLATIELENRASKTSAIIVGSFVLSFLPITILLMIDSSNKIAVELCFTLMCCSSAINPLVYAWKNNRFRAAVVNIFPCVRPNRVSPLHDPSRYLRGTTCTKVHVSSTRDIELTSIRKNGDN
jgi:hypothetical protein